MLVVGAQVPLENSRDYPLVALRRLLAVSVPAICVLCLVSAALRPGDLGQASELLGVTTGLLGIGFQTLWSEAPSSSFSHAERVRL